MHLLPVAAAVFLAAWATGAFYPERRSHFLWRSTSKGEQHQPSFRAVNPNARDRRRRRPGRQRGAGFQLERHQTGRFLGQPADRGELLSWLFFLGTGLGPFSGQAVHFEFAAPDGLDYAVNRYRREAERHNRVLDSQLAGRDYIVGSDYTIVDMSAWGWIVAPLV